VQWALDQKSFESFALDGMGMVMWALHTCTRVPDLVVYTEIAAGARMLMKGITKIKPEWLATMAPALCTFGKPLEQPAPRYDPKNDAILCYMSGMLFFLHSNYEYYILLAPFVL
jgi:hypothetical protein